MMLTRAAQAGRDRLIRLDRARARAVSALFNRAHARLETQSKLLATLGYHNVLARGFALVRSAGGAMIRRAGDVAPGAALDIEFADGHLRAHADAGARKREPEAKRRQPRVDDKQGSLL
jgi:exodeoxyribonuclease VII large subunit